MPLLPPPAVPAGPPAQPGRRTLLSALGLGLLLSACGGGGGGFSGLPGSGGTGFASGPIGGFGSLIVNGVRYDDSAAEIRDDEGQLVPRGSGATDPLQLGVIVDLSGSIDSATLSGRIDRLVFRAELTGRVEAVDGPGQQLTVLGQTVRLKPSTVYAGLAGGAADLAPDQVLEIHGLRDAGGAVVATRIERKAARLADYTGDFRLRGSLSGLGGSAPNQTFRVLGVDLLTDAGSALDAPLSEGAFLSLRLDPAPVGGRYRVKVARLKSTGFSQPDLDRAEVEGFITRFGSLGDFEVNGFPVRTDGSTVFEDGSAGVVLGARVEVKGRVSGGVLLAREVEIDALDDNDASNDGAEDGGVDGSDAPFEFEGTVSELSGDASAGRFIVQGELVVYDSATRFQDGLGPATLAGQNVEVRAFADGVDGGRTRYRATRISRDD